MVLIFYFRAFAADDICIPPRCEINIEVNLPGKNEFGAPDYIFEPEENFLRGDVLS